MAGNKVVKPDSVPPQSGGPTGMGADAPPSGNMSNHKRGPTSASKDEKAWKRDKVPPATSSSGM